MTNSPHIQLVWTELNAGAPRTAQGTRPWAGLGRALDLVFLRLFLLTPLATKIVIKTVIVIIIKN